MRMLDRLLILVSLLGLVAALGLATQPVQARLPALESRPPMPRAEPSSVPALPMAQVATPTRTPTPINVGNFVWNDLDGDGVQDAGEPGLNGIQVQLWNSAKNDLIDTAVTNASGIYALTAPTPGNYRVRALLPAGGYTFSPENLGGDDLKDSDINPSGTDAGFTDIYVFASNLISITTIDVGMRPPPGSPTPTRTPTPINVGNFVWNDLDGDGMQDAGEPGLNGVQVQLWNSAKNDLIDTAFTNASGIYALTAPTPGNYRVRVLLPVGATFTLKDQNGDDLKDSDINPSGTDFGFTDIYVFGSNLISITTIDAGIRPPPGSPTPTRTPTPINVGNFVWNDLDGDGAQDAGEPGLNGVQVQLWNSAKNDLIDTAFTNANGNYTLIAPTPGNYRVRVLKPSGATFSLKDQGGDDLKDSDINPDGADAGFTDVYVFGSNLISITTIDAGLTSVPATPTMTAEPVGGPEKAYLPRLIK